MIRILNLSGTYRDIGRQHGAQVADLRPQIQIAMKERLSALRTMGGDYTHYQEEILQIWEQHTPDTVEMLAGIAEALKLDRADYFTYTLSSYLMDRLKQVQNRDGCSAWAASGMLTQDGNPILAKNRDYHPDHQLLQCVARIRPQMGYPYICLTSAGSPGVFSSGINAAGLAIADTYVGSTDVGPGIGRYSLMMAFLEKCCCVQEAIDLLPAVPHSGSGTMTLADAQGDLAVFEIAHSAQAIRLSDEGFLASTNHFSAPLTHDLWVEREPEHLRGNSQARRKHIETALRSAQGQIDLPFSQKLMAYHGDVLTSLCRHPDIEADSITISSVIYLPRQRSMYVANGLPCSANFDLVRVID